jgi:Protein of unknown function (DUF 659)
VLLVTPKGEFFIEAIDISDDTKSMQYITDKIGEHVTRQTNSVVINGACKGAIEKLQERFNWLFGIVCSTHGMALMMDNIGQLDFAVAMLERVQLWDAVAFLKDVFEPMHTMLCGLTDSRTPMMGKFYKLMSNLGGTLDELF